MLGKTMLFGLLLASTPFVLVAAPQSGGGRADCAPEAQRPDERGEVQRLRVRLREAQAREARIQERLDRLEAQLRECLDLLVQCEEGQRRRTNCTPSRSRTLMTRYEWMRERGHDEHAEQVLARLVERCGDNLRRLNSEAWELMTDDDTAGRFDALALAFADRMLQREDSLDHRMLDTVALAKFLDGQVDEAVRLQSAAVERNSNDDDYRRRLRTYQAAQRTLAARQQERPAERANAERKAVVAELPGLHDD